MFTRSNSLAAAATPRDSLTKAAARKRLSFPDFRFGRSADTKTKSARYRYLSLRLNGHTYVGVHGPRITKFRMDVTIFSDSEK